MSSALWLTFPRPEPRRGQPWSADEEAYLVKAVRRGDSLDRICDLLGRPYSAIVSRLTKLYLVRWVPVMRNHEWDYPKTGRRGVVPRTRDEAFRVTPEEFRKMYRFCKLFMTGNPV